GRSIGLRYVVSIASGGQLSATASRERLACTLVSTGNFVPLTCSKRRIGRLCRSFSSLTTSAVISYAGSTVREITCNASGVRRLTASRKPLRSWPMAAHIIARSGGLGDVLSAVL